MDVGCYCGAGGVEGAGLFVADEGIRTGFGGRLIGLADGLDLFGVCAEGAWLVSWYGWWDGDAGGLPWLRFLKLGSNWKCFSMGAPKGVGSDIVCLSV